jgi:RNA polymerase sigma factor (sigma-70 family)
MNEQSSLAFDACVGGGSRHDTRRYRRIRRRARLSPRSSTAERYLKLGLPGNRACVFEGLDLTQDELIGHLVRLWESGWIQQQLFKRFWRAADVEDARNEVFVRALGIHPDTLAGLESPEAYVLSVINSIQVDQIRRRLKEEGGLDKLARLGSPSLDHDPGPFTATLNIQFSAIIQQAIAELPPKCRRVYEMRAEKHLSFAEIAEALGSSESTVKKQWATAGQKLAKAIAAADPSLGEGPR